MAPGVGEKGGGTEEVGGVDKGEGVLDPSCKLGRFAIGYAQLKWFPHPYCRIILSANGAGLAFRKWKRQK